MPKWYVVVERKIDCNHRIAPHTHTHTPKRSIQFEDAGKKKRHEYYYYHRNEQEKEEVGEANLKSHSNANSFTYHDFWDFSGIDLFMC